MLVAIRRCPTGASAFALCFGEGNLLVPAAVVAGLPARARQNSSATYAPQPCRRRTAGVAAFGLSSAKKASSNFIQWPEEYSSNQLFG